MLFRSFQRCEPNYGWGPGVRDHYLIHYVASGRGVLTADGKTFQINSGNMFLIYPGTQVHYTADSQAPWEYIWVGFDGSDAPFLLSQAGFTPGRPYLTIDDAALTAEMMAIYESRGSQVHEVTRMTGRLYGFLAGLIERASPESRGMDDPLLICARNAAAYIAGNYSRPLTVDDIAADAAVSRSGLYRSFRRHLGVSPMQYVIHCRIERACALLQNTGSSVSGVARAVGFEDPLYFSRAFKAAKGCSPSAYRKAII